MPDAGCHVARRNVAPLQDSRTDAANNLVEAVIWNAVIDLRAVVLAQADQHHFHEAAFDVADEIGVRLDPAARLT